MAVVGVFQSPTLTQEQYEETIRRLTGGKDRMESPSDWPVPGLLVHIAGQGDSGFRVVDVWESQEAFDSFGEKLMPVLQELGIEVRPEIYQAHAEANGAKMEAFNCNYYTIRNGKIAEVQVMMADQHNYDAFMWAAVPLKPLPDRLK